MSRKLINLALIGAATVSKVVYRVDDDHRAVVVDSKNRVKNKVFGPGFHIIKPWCEKAVVYNVRKRSFSTETCCFDIYQRKEVTSKIRLALMERVHMSIDQVSINEFAIKL